MIKIYFDNTLIDENYYSALTNDYKLFTDNFYLGSTASNTFKLSVAKTAVSSHPTEVKITDDTNTYYLIVDKIYEEKNFYVYDLVDKLVLFNFNYNAKTLIDARAAEELTTTLTDILTDMCTQAGVTLDGTLTLINDIEVDWYDNTILARDYLSYIAELQGGFARILDDGKLTIVGQKMASQATIQIDNCEDFILGEKKTISRVVYDNGIVKYEYGDETANTLYINPNNVYITDTTVVSNIYDEVAGLEFYLVETGKCRLDPSVRAGDIITFTDGTNSYLTIAGYSASFGGGYWLGNYSLNVASKQQEETQVKGVNTELKSIKTIIDRTNASLSIVASSVSTLEGEVENIELQRPFYRYSANADGSSMTTSPQASTRYLGTYVGTVASATYTDYTWTLIKGADGQDGQDGVDGLPGTPGADGITYYTWIRYSDNADGTGLYDTPTANTLYIGIAHNKTSATPSSTKTDYVWSKFKGDTGTAGSDGADGVTTYTWIKYADDVNGTNLSDNPTGKTYIGLAHNKTTATESTTPSDYTWALIKGADGAAGSDGVGITSAEVTYQLHTNGTTAPTGSWLSSPPTPVQGKYLWTRTVTTYTNSSTSTTYAVSYYATDGQTGSAGSDGTGISSTEVKYQIGTSGTVAPTGTWLDNVPTAEQGKYLWTRTIITYTDNSTSTAYSTSYYATDGERGSVIWTTTTAPATPDYTFTISNLVGGDVPRTGDIILYSYYKYTVETVSATTLLAGTRVSIRGATGATGTGAKWYTGTAITGTSTTATVFSGSGITAAIVGDMYLNTSTNNTYRCTLAGNAATAKWVFEVNIKGLDGSDGDDGKSLWLAYCDEIDTYTGFSINPADSDKDYYGMYIGLTQSNTATDYEWYPSNYKIESEIVSLTTTLTQTAEGLQVTTEQVAEVSNLASTTQIDLLNTTELANNAIDNSLLALEGVETLEDTTSALGTATNDLTTRMNYQETTVSDLLLDIDGVKQSMTYSGGYNLIENCVKQFGEAGWTGTFENYSNTEIQQNSLTKSALVFMNDTETREIQTENRVHNFSFKYKKLVPLATTTITINGIVLTLTEDEWTEVEQNIVVESNLVTIEYSSDADNSVWLVDPLLIPGNIQQIWTPNPNEINTGVIKLGGDTLTIESTSSSTVFKASTDGTRVYNVNDLDNPIAEFTSEGVETNKITGTKGEIGKVLILDLGTQTWFSRM